MKLSPSSQDVCEVSIFKFKKITFFFNFIKSKYLDIEKEFVKNKNKDFTL